MYIYICIYIHIYIYIYTHRLPRESDENNKIKAMAAECLRSEQKTNKKTPQEVGDLSDGV